MSGALRSDATALAAVGALLGPVTSVGRPLRRYAVLPSRGRPRYLLPVRGRSGAGAHLRPGSGRKAAAARHALRGAVRMGGLHLVPGALGIPEGTAEDPSLRRHLGRLLGHDDIEVAVALGAPRSNRKPVIQVLGAAGETRAWAKLGVDAHTDALVAHETGALAERPGPPVVVPEVLASGEWHGHPLLVLAHMAMTETTDDLTLTAAAVRAMAGPITRQVATASPWWEDLRADAAIEPPDGPVVARVEQLEARLGQRAWPFGRGHGDLAPWNATWEGDELKVWDWERSVPSAPVGLDAVHNQLQVALFGRGVDLASAMVDARRDLGPLLIEVGHAPGDVPLVVEAYLATLRVRYAGDARHGTLGPVAELAACLDADAVDGVGSRADHPDDPGARR